MVGESLANVSVSSRLPAGNYSLLVYVEDEWSGVTSMGFGQVQVAPLAASGQGMADVLQEILRMPDAEDIASPVLVLATSLEDVEDAELRQHITSSLFEKLEVATHGHELDVGQALGIASCIDVLAGQEGATLELVPQLLGRVVTALNHEEAASQDARGADLIAIKPRLANLVSLLMVDEQVGYDEQMDLLAEVMSVGQRTLIPDSAPVVVTTQAFVGSSFRASRSGQGSVQVGAVTFPASLRSAAAVALDMHVVLFPNSSRFEQHPGLQTMEVFMTAAGSPVPISG
jgi:hypothetical protein